MIAYAVNKEGILIVGVFKGKQTGHPDAIHDAKVVEKDGYITVTGYKEKFVALHDDDMLKRRYDIENEEEDDWKDLYYEYNEYMDDVYEIPEDKIKTHTIYEKQNFFQRLFCKKKVKEKVRIVKGMSVSGMSKLRGVKVPYKVRSSHYILEEFGKEK
jgi:hypothetical protein